MYTLDQSVQDLQFQLPELGYCTSDSIPQFVPAAGENREVAYQLSDVNRNPISRRFSEFAVEDPSATAEVRPLDGYDDFYESDFIYVVASQFVETSYEALVPPVGMPPFREWKVDKTTYRREIHYKPAVISNVTWERPYTTPPLNPELKIYQHTAVPLVVTFDNNRAIAGRFTQWSNNCTAVLKNTLSPTEVGDPITNPTSPFICYKRYVQVTCQSPNDTGLSPTFLTVEYSGEAVFNFCIPINNQNEYTLVHPETVSDAEKLFPPGKYQQFPDHFWNWGNPPPQLSDFSNRTGNPSLV